MKDTLQIGIPDLSDCRIEVQPNEQFVSLSFYQKHDGQWRGFLALGFDRIPQLIIDLQNAKPLAAQDEVQI